MNWRQIDLAYNSVPVSGAKLGDFTYMKSGYSIQGSVKIGQRERECVCTVWEREKVDNVLKILYLMISYL